MTACACLLVGCAASTRSGETAGLRLDPPPAEMVQEIAPPTRLPSRAMTQVEVERAWSTDRAALATGRARHSALVDWYAARDAALRGGQLTGASPGFSPVK